ncbi:unnamed protein product [Diamesa tonsa]
MIRNLLNRAVSLTATTLARSPRIITTRGYPAIPKKFYKNSSILCSDDKFEITLDTKKLKTPRGTPFYVESEPLAHAICHEWNSQKENIEQSGMYLTALANTVIDNPNNLTKDDIVNYLMNYAETDTILFHDPTEEKLYAFEQQEWNPMIEWFNKRYDTALEKTTGISPPEFKDSAKRQITNHLKSYSLPALHGYMFAVETVKSIILAFACIDRYITPEKAVLLSRLEEEYQLGHWGRVEWAHELNQQELQARLAAAVFFVHCNSFSHLVKSKGMH